MNLFFFFFNVVIMFILDCLSVCMDNNKYKSSRYFLHAPIEGVKVPKFGLVYKNNVGRFRL